MEIPIIEKEVQSHQSHYKVRSMFAQPPFSPASPPASPNSPFHHASDDAGSQLPPVSGGWEGAEDPQEQEC